MPEVGDEEEEEAVASEATAATGAPPVLPHRYGRGD
jgi:hypothetical protein